MKPQNLLFHQLVLHFFVVSLFANTLPLASGTYDACATLKITTSNGIKVGFENLWEPNVDTIYINSIDSMTMSFKAGGGCPISIMKIKIDAEENNYLLNPYPYSSPSIKLLAKPGRYEISANVSSYPEKMYFNLIMNPVGTKEITKNLQNIMVFPNPCVNKLSITSENDQLVSLVLISSEGIRLKSFITENATFEIPLNQYPPGLYFLQVTTLSGVTEIKKVIVL